LEGGTASLIVNSLIVGYGKSKLYQFSMNLFNELTHPRKAENQEQGFDNASRKYQNSKLSELEQQIPSRCFIKSPKATKLLEGH
jgi:hypothetical protein